MVDQQAHLRAAFNNWTIVKLSDATKQAEQRAAQRQPQPQNPTAATPHPVQIVATTAEVDQHVREPQTFATGETVPHITLHVATLPPTAPHSQAPSQNPPAPAQPPAAQTQDDSEEKRQPLNTVAVSVVSDTASVLPKSCLGGEGRRSRNASVSRRVRWVDWDVE